MVTMVKFLNLLISFKLSLHQIALHLDAWDKGRESTQRIRSVSICVQRESAHAALLGLENTEVVRGNFQDNEVLPC
jgi:hypothetical protein